MRSNSAFLEYDVCMSTFTDYVCLSVCCCVGCNMFVDVRCTYPKPHMFCVKYMLVCTLIALSFPFRLPRDRVCSMYVGALCYTVLLQYPALLSYAFPTCDFQPFMVYLCVFLNAIPVYHCLSI